MKTCCLVLEVLVCLATAFASTPGSPDKESEQLYVDGTYKVMLRCPAEWKKDSGHYDQSYLGTEPHLGKVNRGFFKLDVAGDESTTPEQSCKGFAEHVVKPFGSNPTIKSLEVDGQSACLVWPSGDQGAPWDAEVVVRYPAPVEIEGERYSLLELNADKDYILAIIRTLKFISSHENPPFSVDIAPSNGKAQGTETRKVGAPVFIAVTMANNTRQVLHFPFAKPGADYQFDVIERGPGGLFHKHLGEKEHVAEEYLELQREREGAPSAAENEITLKPQETYHKTIEIGSILLPDRPGKYAVQMGVKLPEELGKGLVLSNTVTVTVSEK